MARASALPGAICGKLCVGCRAADVGAQNVFWQEQRASLCESLHTVCRKGVVMVLLRLAAVRACEAGEAFANYAGN